MRQRGILCLGLLTPFLVALHSNAAEGTWIPTGAPVTNWACLATSADGSKLAAGVVYGGIYLSTNSGTNWELSSAPIAPWSRIASSADGEKLFAVDGYGFFFGSTNSGATWFMNNAVRAVSVACSADGRNVAAAGAGELHGGAPGLWVSANSGGTWTAVRTGYWVDLVCSADGMTVAASEFNNLMGPHALSISKDFGAIWTNPNVDGLRLAASADASRLLTSTNDGIYISLDSSSSWNFSSLPRVQSLACSSDGERVTAICGNSIYSSADTGFSWVSNSAPALPWASVTSSADGSRVFAAAYPGGIYVFQITPTPQLRVAASSQTRLLLSWVASTLPFRLEETDDLSSEDWRTVNITPTLNFTNVNLETSLDSTGDHNFYRLSWP